MYIDTDQLHVMLPCTSAASRQRHLPRYERQWLPARVSRPSSKHSARVRRSSSVMFASMVYQLLYIANVTWGHKAYCALNRASKGYT